MPLYETLRIAVIYGGSSNEASISRVSGKQVSDSLRYLYKYVIEFELDRDIGHNLMQENIDIVFPMMHGKVGEDGTFQGFLEIFGIPYVGSQVAASAVAMDKRIAKCLFTSVGLPVPSGSSIIREQYTNQMAFDLVDKLGSSLIIKPSNQGSALGIKFINGVESLITELEKSFIDYEALIIEKRIIGREITVGILENNGLLAFPVIEITTPKDSWYDYKHRYTPGLSQHIIPARLSQNIQQKVQSIAKAAHQVLGCRDFSRVDFLIDQDNNLYVLEVNTIPGMTPTSLYPEGALAAGIKFPELLDILVKNALQR